LENESRLEVFFRVTKIIKYEEEIQLIPKEEYDIFRSRIDRDFTFINDILLDELNKSESWLSKYLGINSTSRGDYQSQLQDSDIMLSNIISVIYLRKLKF
jgi:exodeoxyribonuclease VII large subunit